MPQITNRLSVEGPDREGYYALTLQSDDMPLREWLTRAEADALIAALSAKGYVDWGSGELLAMAALDAYPINDGLPKSTSVVFRIHQLGRALEAALTPERLSPAETQKRHLDTFGTGKDR